jgi:hypothetical protein
MAPHDHHHHHHHHDKHHHGHHHHHHDHHEAPRRRGLGACICGLFACAFALLGFALRCLGCVFCALCRRRPPPAEAKEQPLIYQAPPQVVVLPSAASAPPAPAPAPEKAHAINNLNIALARGEITAAQFAASIAAMG